METFIEKAKKIHNDKYVYFSEETYINNRTPIKIKCKKHGIFYQKPNSHLNGHGCPVCRESKLEKEIYTFLQEKNISHRDVKPQNILLFPNNTNSYCTFLNL